MDFNEILFIFGLSSIIFVSLLIFLSNLGDEHEILSLKFNDFVSEAKIKYIEVRDRFNIMSQLITELTEKNDRLRSKVHYLKHGRRESNTSWSESDQV